MNRSKHRILITGANGQLGRELTRVFLSLGRVIPTAVHADGERVLPLDLANPDNIRRVLDDVRPTLIINAAAYTAVDQAEDDIATADAINGIAPGLLAEQARAYGACLIHYSTDYVFDGCKNAPYTEIDPPSPINAYGRTKLAGEHAVAAGGGTHFIFRTSWLYSARGRNFLLTMLRLAQGSTPMRIVDDQHGAPTWARSVAELTGQIVAQSLQQEAGWLEERTGIYHVTAAESCSWYEFARAILEQTGNHGALARLEPTTTAAYPLKAVRPAYSILDCERLWQTFGLRLGPWREALSLVTEDLQLQENALVDDSPPS